MIMAYIQQSENEKMDEIILIDCNELHQQRGINFHSAIDNVVENKCKFDRFTIHKHK